MWEEYKSFLCQWQPDDMKSNTTLLKKEKKELRLNHTAISDLKKQKLQELQLRYLHWKK